MDAGPEAVPLAAADLKGPLALAVGAEGAGLSRLLREHCDWLLAIPMYGMVGSLNAPLTHRPGNRTPASRLNSSKGLTEDIHAARYYRDPCLSEASSARTPKRSSRAGA
jgi:hypothetical protein